MAESERWAIRTLEEGYWIRADFADLSIVVLHRYEEWRVAALGEGFKDLPHSGSAGDLPDGIEFQRWDNDPKDRSFQFRPTFPMLPVVAKPKSVLNLSPQGKASFFIGVPAWIEVVAECQGAMRSLAVFPTEELSKTWHGGQSDGHLGYALKTYARRVYEDHAWPEYEILCPIHLINDGKEMLAFDRLYLETDHLAVFEHGGRLWSNAARIRDVGENGEFGSITYGAKPSQPYDDALEITPPRKGKVRQSVMKSAFSKMLGSFNPMDE